MVFKRVWDSTCPRVYDRWESNGKTWVIQDLEPKDDELALQILMEHMVPDEPLCSASNLLNDPVSMASMKQMWEDKLPRRMSLGCYTEEGGKMTLVALNVCYVVSKDEEDHIPIEGESWKNVFGVLDYAKKKCDGLEYMGVDQALYAMGLVVRREYRGERLGQRILAAREPLCLSQGIKGTETIFTGPASQKLAERCGFKTVLEVSFKELADSGFKLPRLDKVVKVMVKKYE